MRTIRFICTLCFIVVLTSSAAAQSKLSKESVQKWREDLLFLKERFPAYDKTLTPFLFLNPYEMKLWAYSEKSVLEEFLKGVDALHAGADSLSEEELMIGISKLIALSPNAHTRFYLFRVRTVMNNAPIGLYWFGNDLHIVSAATKYSSILGSRIKAINGMALDSVKRRVDELISGNASWKKYMGLYFLRSPQAMKGLRIGSDRDQLELTVVTPKGKEQTISLQADFVPQQATLEAWKDLSPVSVQKDSITSVLEGSVKVLPLYLQHTHQSYSYTYLEKEKLAYLQFNRTQDMATLSFKDFTEQMIKDLKTKPFQKFVLDLRFNTGGNNDVAKKALEELGQHLKGKQVYMITGAATFSAGIVAGAVFKKATGARVIGEEAGDGLVFLSEGGNVVLPNSRLNAHYSNGFHYWNFNNDFSIAPDVYLVNTYADYAKGMDAVMNYIIRQ